MPIVIDANSMIARCIMASALDDLKAGGLWTGGVYGTLGLLRGFIEHPDIEAGSIYAFFDHGVPPERIKNIPEYKQDRKEKRKLLSDDDKERAFRQLHLCRLMFETLGIVCSAFKDREADDCVAAAVRVLVERGHEPLVWSGDKDLLQCVDMGAVVCYQKDFVIEDNFREVAGTDPRTYLAYRAMVGDASDNIKGVEGIGPKKASELLAGLGDLLSTLDCPHDQVKAIREGLQGAHGVKLRKFETNFLHATHTTGRLHDIIRGTDLRDSFGGTAGLEKVLDRKPSVDRMAFLRFCKRLSFKSVLGSPNRYVRPFEAAEKRRA